MNINKTNYIVFNPSSANNTDIRVELNDIQLENKKSARFLGITVDAKLNWNEHCAELVKRINVICFQIRKLKLILPHSFLLQYYYAQVYSRLSYGVVFWGGSVGAQDVFIAQKRIVRSFEQI
ncbi:hypothetical protein QE152_g8302 [Popillia japonica]|uniref:Reverse transcriptase domain-containing protein n=1 Tax=Popillia japonica TaxID=7064 RepID=A0AAW1M4E8_POPJA